MSRTSLRYRSVCRVVLLFACCTLLASGVATAADDPGTAAVKSSPVDRPVDILDDATDELDSTLDSGDETTDDETGGDESTGGETTEDADASASTRDSIDGSADGLLRDGLSGQSGDADDGSDRLNDSDGVAVLTEGTDTGAEQDDSLSDGLEPVNDTPLRLGFGSDSSIRFAFGPESGLWLGTGTDPTLRVDLADRMSVRLRVGPTDPPASPEERDGHDPNGSTTADGTDRDTGVPTDHSETRSSINAGLVGALGLSAIAGSASATGGSGGATTAGSPAVLGRLLSVLGQFGSALTSLLAKKLPLSLLRYSRYDDSDPLDHETRRSIYETIEADPGQYLSAIEAETGVSLSTVRHHLDVLEGESLIVAEKRNGKRRFYPVASEHRELAAAMDEPARARVIEALATKGPMTNGELADRLERDPSTISHHVAALADDGLLERTRDGRSIRNALAPGVEATYRERIESEPDVQSPSGPRPVGVEGAD